MDLRARNYASDIFSIFGKRTLVVGLGYSMEHHVQIINKCKGDVDVIKTLNDLLYNVERIMEHHFDEYC